MSISTKNFLGFYDSTIVGSSQLTLIQSAIENGDSKTIISHPYQTLLGFT